MAILRSYFHKRILMAICAVTIGIAMIGMLCQLILALGDLRLSGLSTPDFLIYMILKLPQVTAVTLPFCVFIGTLITLNAARTDNEITSLQAYGVSFWRLAVIGMLPALLIAAIQMILYFHTIPFSRITSFDLLRANAAKALAGVVSGTFVSPIPGLTLRYDKTGGNAYSGVFANYNDGSSDTTYIARSALLRDDDDTELALVMYDGAIMSFSGEGASGVLAFDQYALNLSGLIDQSQFEGGQTDSLYIGQLFDTPPVGGKAEPVSALRAEGHFRISTPFLTPFLSLLAGLAVVGGRVSRRHYAWRIALFSSVAVIILIVPYILSELARRIPELIWLYYALPILVGAGLFASHANASSNRPRL